MRKQHTAVAALFVILAVAMTWPLARNLDRAAAFPGDPYLTMWILDWDHYATIERLPLFHTNAFHPARYSLAFSENLYGIALLLMPFRFAGVDVISAHNIAILAGFAFSGFGAYLLSRKLTGSFVAGLAGGVFYAFVPFRFTQTSHVPYVWGGWIALLLLALLAYVDAPSWRRAIAFGAAFAMNGLTNIHWLFFGSFAVAATAALFYASGVRRWRELLIATAGGMLVLAPFLYPYWAAAKLYGMTRPWADVKQYSAHLSDWFVATDQNYVYRALREASVDPERWLFPGALSIVMSIVAVMFIRRFTRAVTIGVLWVAIGVVGSLGVNSFFHTFLYDAVPGFKAVRAPARWAVIAYLGLAILIAVITTVLERRRVWLAAVVPLALLVELRAAPMRWYMMINEPAKVYTWLAQQTLKGAVLELPLAGSGGDYDYLLWSTVHRQKLVNGVSGFVPPHLEKLVAAYRSGSISDGFTDELRRIGVALVIVHFDRLGESSGPAREWIRREIDRGRMRFVGRFDGGAGGGDWVFAFGRPFARPPLVEAFLAGRRTYNNDTFGNLERVPDMRGPGWFSGYALSPHGIRSVDLLFSNGAVRVPATLIEDKNLSRDFPWYPQCPLPRFIAAIEKRPKGVRERTDVQVEIIDGRGKRTRLLNQWFMWSD
jgi:hypothetical protein